ncbi:MAG: excisionase family DNA-binding protein [Deltaproteobacteria bacterium]|nr:excisionase family DNA-binding protein [Deltaproteobacteria bacterium]
MAKAYLTLTGEKIDLSSVTALEKVFLGQAVKFYEAGDAYPNFVNRVNAPGSAALGGGQWVTEKVTCSPLYRICQDLADRLGIAQGFLAIGKNSSTERPTFIDAATEPDIISCEDAAQLAGVTAEAIRKAIRAKRLPARQVGRTYLLERKAVDAYAARSGRKVNVASGANGQGARETVGKASKRRQGIEATAPAPQVPPPHRWTAGSSPPAPVEPSPPSASRLAAS